MLVLKRYIFLHVVLMFYNVIGKFKSVLRQKSQLHLPLEIAQALKSALDTSLREALILKRRPQVP